MISQYGQMHFKNLTLRNWNIGWKRVNPINSFPANVPIMEKPGTWFLPAKCVKNTCGGVTF